MKKSRFTDSQIMDALKRAEAEIKVPAVPGAGHEQRFVLPLVSRIRRHGRVDDGAD